MAKSLGNIPFQFNEDEHSITHADRIELAMEGKKRCYSCKVVKTFDDFNSWKYGTNGLKHQCRKCQSEESKNHRIGMGKTGNKHYWVCKKLRSSKVEARKGGHPPCLATVDELVIVYTTVCQLCGKECGYSICLEHCHETGRFRGFVCQGCNAFLAKYQERTEYLEKVIAYLRKDPAT